MKITVDVKKILPDTHGGTIWAPHVIMDYRLIDVDYLYKDNMAEPACRIENATILAALFTADTCRFVVYRDTGTEWLTSGVTVYGEFAGPTVNTFENQAGGLRKAIETTGAKIETEPDECPESGNIACRLCGGYGNRQYRHFETPDRGMMKTYSVTTRFSFTGKFIVRAETEEEAKKKVLYDCGLVLGRGIHTCRQEGDVDWEFPIHPEKEILNIRQPYKEDDHGKKRKR
jgi:hypothetical protein